MQQASLWLCDLNSCDLPYAPTHTPLGCPPPTPCLTPGPQPLGLTRRLSFTGRPIDIVRNACSTNRNELCALFSK